MDKAVVEQFLSFFEDFIALCQWKDWPSDQTTEAEIKNAFIICNHIEKCLDKFQKNNLLDNFFATIYSQPHSQQASAHVFLKNYLSDPPKYILKKIITSKCKITKMDVAFKIFLEVYTEEQLENYIADLMLKAASKETLVKNLNYILSKEEILVFKSEVLLSSINSTTKERLQEMLTDSDQDAIDLLVVSLCNTNPKHQNSVNMISECVLEVLISKDNQYKKFWKSLFKVEDKYLIDILCVENSGLYTYICEALIDCGKLLRENMSTEYFYLEFTYFELVHIIKRLISNDLLKLLLLDVINNHDTDISFWENVMA